MSHQTGKDSQLASSLNLLHASPHQAGKDGHHHLRVDLHQVLRQGIDFGSDLPGHGDGISGAGGIHTVVKVTDFYFYHLQYVLDCGL